MHRQTFSNPGPDFSQGHEQVLNENGHFFDDHSGRVEDIRLPRSGNLELAGYHYIECHFENIRRYVTHAEVAM